MVNERLGKNMVYIKKLNKRIKETSTFFILVDISIDMYKEVLDRAID